MMFIGLFDEQNRSLFFHKKQIIRQIYDFPLNITILILYRFLTVVRFRQKSPCSGAFYNCRNKGFKEEYALWNGIV